VGVGTHMSNVIQASCLLEDAESTDDVLWYAVHVRSNFERVVSRNLQDKAYELFLPTYRSQRQWSDRKKHVDVPLFPGYVFCRLDPQNRLPVLSVPGVVQIVGQGKSPTAISETEIGAIKTILKSDLPYLPWSSLVAGRRVVVERGPLMGVEGVLMEARGPHRLIVSVMMLQRSVAVEVDASWVRPIAAVTPPPVRMFTHHAPIM
jgi:transcription antitermination factor NusG